MSVVNEPVTDSWYFTDTGGKLLQHGSDDLLTIDSLSGDILRFSSKASELFGLDTGKGYIAERPKIRGILQRGNATDSTSVMVACSLFSSSRKSFDC